MPADPNKIEFRPPFRRRDGWWEWEGARVCLFDVEAELSSLHWAFFDEVGASPAHFLYLAGLRAAVALSSTLDSKHARDGFFRAHLNLLQARGYGLFTLETVSPEPWVAAIYAQGTLEAWAYLRRQRQGNYPVCHYTRGLLAGMACMAVEPVGSPSPDIVCWETECVARGDKACRFVVGSAEELRSRGFNRPEEALSPRWALEEVNTQLKLSADMLREVQTQLDERQQAYQHLLDNMLDPLVVVDRHLKISFFNLRFLEVSGLTAEQALGTDPVELIEPDDRPAFRKMIADLLEGRVRSATHSFRAGRGARRAVLESSARAITGPDGGIAVEAICRDVTERERNRHALEAANRQLLTKQKIADNDLRLAKLVHESLLPRAIKHDAINVDVKYVPVDRVGGDYCHVATIDGRYVVLTLCDVSGHGVAAALLASRVNSHLREQELTDPDPWAITLDMNEFLLTHFGDTGMFVTFLAVTIDLRTLTMRMCGAGHPGPILQRHATGETSSIRSQHLPIGILPDFHRSPHFHTVGLEPGDRLVLYTDGIIDVVDAEGKPLRPQGMEELVRQSSQLDLFEVGDWLLKKVAGNRESPPHDDITLMLVEVKKPLRARTDYSVGTI